MDYTIVNLAEKTVVGVSEITGNSDPNMGKILCAWAYGKSGCRRMGRNLADEFKQKLYRRF